MSASDSSPRALALAARQSSLALQSLPANTRSSIVQHFAASLQQRMSDILAANRRDRETAEREGSLSPSLQSRLVLSTHKLDTLLAGLQQLADTDTLLGRVTEARELTGGLVLRRVSVPLGVLLVIFESRPDVYPQLVALAVMTGNSVMLKGGRESTATLNAMHQCLQQAIKQAESEAGPAADGALSGLVTLLPDRDSVASLLSLDECIDLVIPRGSSELVRHIQQSTHIPVMGHSEGICHMYVHSDADVRTALPLIVDAKCDYPAACNAVECLLLHSSLLKPGPSPDVSSPSALHHILSSLKANGVTCYAGPALQSQLPSLLPSFPHGFHYEYSGLELTVEVVDSLQVAIRHINSYSSHHTDAILCAPQSAAATTFTQQVDSACVFVNASTRFADGYRFGLGAEVGISTGRLHARGPVGMEGLVTYKWILVSEAADGHTVAGEKHGQWQYTHRELHDASGQPVGAQSKHIENTEADEQKC